MNKLIISNDSSLTNHNITRKFQLNTEINSNTSMNTEISSDEYKNLVKKCSFNMEDEFGNIAGSMETTVNIDSEERAGNSQLIQKLGRLLLTVASIQDNAILKNKITSMLEREFSRSIASIETTQWEYVASALDWVGAESSMFGDVVRLCLAISELQNLPGIKSAFILKASYYLEHSLGDAEAGLAAALDAHALSPFSAKTAELVCEKIRAVESKVSASRAAGYWKRLISIYNSVLTDVKFDKERQVAVLLMIGWLYCNGLKDPENGKNYLERAKILDPNNRSVAKALEMLGGA